jgi:hypothetical protein
MAGLQTPFELATLPLPLDRIHGQTFFSEVSSGQPSLKRRKKPRLAVGIDGEGVNIYDVRACSYPMFSSN